MTSHFYDPSFKQDPVVSSSLTIGFGEVGKILADWATVATEGNPQVAIVVSRDVPHDKIVDECIDALHEYLCGTPVAFANKT